MSLVTEDQRAKAEIYKGDSLCHEKCQFLLKEVNLPNGLLPLKDIIECGYIEETGFVWLKQKKKIEHTGVKAKELFIWITLTDISADGGEEGKSSAGKVTFHSSTGLYRTFPAAAFVIEEDEEKKKEVEVKEKVENEVMKA